MNPQFNLPYEEYFAAEEIKKLIGKEYKNISIFIPMSRQEKGIDFILFNKDTKKILSMQVKSSRTYLAKTQLTNRLWFNSFTPDPAADIFLLVGTYPKTKVDPKNINAIKNIKWDSVLFLFNYKEMIDFIDNVRLKKTPEKHDRYYGFGFDSSDKIIGTRGGAKIEGIDFSDHLLKNKLLMLKQMLS
mgnify:CR=1 FL=1